MKLFLFLISVMLSGCAIGAPGKTTNGIIDRFVASNTEGGSKMIVCMEAAEIASFAYSVKEAGKKMPEVTYGTYLDAYFVGGSALIGYTADSMHQAASKAFARCVEAPLWAEITKQAPSK